MTAINNDPQYENLLECIANNLCVSQFESNVITIEISVYMYIFIQLRPDNFVSISDPSTLTGVQYNEPVSNRPYIVERTIHVNSPMYTF